MVRMQTSLSTKLNLKPSFMEMIIQSKPVHTQLATGLIITENIH